VTQADIDEATHVAMTVGATRMQVMLRQEMNSLDGASAGGGAAETSSTSGAAAEGPVAADGAATPAPAFRAQEVIAEAGDG
jgi:hypothetical protein